MIVYAFMQSASLVDMHMATPNMPCATSHFRTQPQKTDRKEMGVSYIGHNPTWTLHIPIAGLLICVYFMGNLFATFNKMGTSILGSHSRSKRAKFFTRVFRLGPRNPLFSNSWLGGLVSFLYGKSIPNAISKIGGGLYPIARIAPGFQPDLLVGPSWGKVFFL